MSEEYYSLSSAETQYFYQRDSYDGDGCYQVSEQVVDQQDGVVLDAAGYDVGVSLGLGDSGG